MDVQVQGISPVVSVLLLLILFLLALGISWLGYSYLTSIRVARRWTLILLRSVSLSILFLLLLNPFIMIRESESRTPEIAVYVDNSRSLSVSRGDYNGIGDYSEILERFDLVSEQDVTYRFFHFDDQVEAVSDPVPLLNGGVTNLEEVMRHIRDQIPDASAAMLFSDGVVTRGRDPLFTARDITIPLFIVPVGDTTRIRDAMISDVLTDDTGYLNSEHLVDIQIRQTGMQGSRATLRLSDDTNVLETEELQFEDDSSVQTVRFAIPLQETGLQRYEIELSSGGADQAIENNSFPLSVNVLDDKTDIVHIAFEIHPDVGALRRLMSSNRNIELETGTWTGSGFLEGIDYFSVPADADLLILHGIPPSGYDLGALTNGDHPVFYLLTPSITPEDISELPLSLTMSGSGGTIGVRLRLHDDLLSSSLLGSEPANRYETFRHPLLSVMDGTYTLSPPARMAVSAVREELDSGIPVLVTESSGNLRQSLITAYGWYQLLQHDLPEIRDFSETLLTNLIFWTATDPDQRLLKIDPLSPLFRESDDVRFRAALTDETGEGEADAVIEVVVTDETQSRESFTMQNFGNGRYELSAGRFPSGQYQFEAIARISGNELERQTGAFSVEESTLEFLDTRRDDRVLSAIAELTGGSVLDHDSAADFLAGLDRDGLLEPVVSEHSYFRYLHEHIIWFLLVILLLTLEWIMRRQVSLP